MPIEVGNVDLRKLDSATQYPSIPTYHELGERGRLLDHVQVPFGAEVIWTEKIDGTNVRLIVTGDTRAPVIVGSRNELLWAVGDYIMNPTMGILDAVSPYLSQIIAVGTNIDLLTQRYIDKGILVLYGEVYGHKIGKAAKQYTTAGRTGFRMFDAAIIPTRILDDPIESIAQWRDNLMQPFLGWDDMVKVSRLFGIPTVPRVGSARFGLPQGIQGMLDQMNRVGTITQAGFDQKGKAEGFVLRSPSGSMMAKVRFEDYERTLKATT